MDVFKFLKSARLGAQSIEFYEKWAMFEASNGYYKKAKAVIQSASTLNITGSMDKVREINDIIDQLEQKSKSVDKENIYPTNSLKTRRKLVSPGLKVRDIVIDESSSDVPNSEDSKSLEGSKVD